MNEQSSCWLLVIIYLISLQQCQSENAIDPPNLIAEVACVYHYQRFVIERLIALVAKMNREINVR